MPNFKVKSTKNGQNQNTPAPSLRYEELNSEITLCDAFSQRTNWEMCVPFNRFTSEYDSIERLGKGAFGRVFKAKQKLLQKYYAIKIIRCRE